MMKALNTFVTGILLFQLSYSKVCFSAYLEANYFHRGGVAHGKGACHCPRHSRFENTCSDGMAALQALSLWQLGFMSCPSLSWHPKNPWSCWKKSVWRQETTSCGWSTICQDCARERGDIIEYFSAGDTPGWFGSWWHVQASWTRLNHAVGWEAPSIMASLLQQSLAISIRRLLSRFTRS